MILNLYINLHGIHVIVSPYRWEECWLVIKTQETDAHVMWEQHWRMLHHHFLNLTWKCFCCLHNAEACADSHIACVAVHLLEKTHKINITARYLTNRHVRIHCLHHSLYILYLTITRNKGNQGQKMKSSESGVRRTKARTQVSDAESNCCGTHLSVLMGTIVPSDAMLVQRGLLWFK